MSAVDLREILAPDELRDLVHGGLARETGGHLVASATALPRDLRDVEAFGGRPQADPPCRPVLSRRLADERGDLRALDRAEVVDDPFRIGLLRPDRVEVLPLEMRDDHSPTLEDAGVVERFGDQLQLGEGDVLVNALEDAVYVGASLHELSSNPERLRGGVRILEAPGIGD